MHFGLHHGCMVGTICLRSHTQTFMLWLRCIQTQGSFFYKRFPIMVYIPTCASQLQQQYQIPKRNFVTDSSVSSDCDIGHEQPAKRTGTKPFGSWTRAVVLGIKSWDLGPSNQRWAWTVVLGIKCLGPRTA